MFDAIGVRIQIGLFVIIAIGHLVVAVVNWAHSVHFTALWTWADCLLYVIGDFRLPSHTNALWALSQQWDASLIDATGIHGLQAREFSVVTTSNKLGAGNRGRGQTDGSPTNYGGVVINAGVELIALGLSLAIRPDGYHISPVKGRTLWADRSNNQQLDAIPLRIPGMLRSIKIIHIIFFTGVLTCNLGYWSEFIDNPVLGPCFHIVADWISTLPWNQLTHDIQLALYTCRIIDNCGILDQSKYPWYSWLAKDWCCETNQKLEYAGPLVDSQR